MPARTGGERGSRELLCHAFALAGFGAVAMLYLRPFWAVFRTHIASDRLDPVFNLYLLKWVGHELPRGFSGFWDPPFFFPTRGVLAYSDHLLGPGLVATALAALLPGWVAAYNILLLASFAFTGWSMCWVLRGAGRSWAAAVLGGAMYAFSPFRWDQLPHIQVLLMAAIPPTLWTFDRLLAAPSGRRAAAFLLCYLIHLSGGCYLAFMIHIPLLALALAHAPELLLRGGRAPLTDLGKEYRPDSRRRELWVLLAVAATAAVALAATFAKYWQVARRDGLDWDPGQARTWGASLLSFLQPSWLSLYRDLWPAALYRPENALFPGWLAAGLAATGALLLWRLRQRRLAEAGTRRAPRWLLLPLGLAALGWLGAELHTWSLRQPFEGLEEWVPGHGYKVSLALIVVGGIAWLAGYRRSVGRWPLAPPPSPHPPPQPADRWQSGLLLAGASTAALATPLFFISAARILPGLGSMRVPARFHAFTMVAIVWLAALALDRLLARVRRCGVSWYWALALTLAAVLLVELAPRPVSWVILPEEDDFPPVYHWLAGQPAVAALLEVPIDDSRLYIPVAGGVEYMYFGTLHWRPLVNGSSAHFAPAFEALRERCCWPAPDAASLAMLQRWGVTHLLVHRSRLPGEQRRALAQWEASSKAELVYAGGGNRVYRLPPAPLPP